MAHLSRSCSRFLWRSLRLASFLALSFMFLYQASRITEEYLAYPTAVDVKMEGQGTLKYPGISFCVTNWFELRVISRAKGFFIRKAELNFLVLVAWRV